MVQLNDPDATMNVFKRAADFPRPCWVNDVLGVFGPNISCAEDDMLCYWSSKTYVKSGAEDMRTLTLNVLARAGFGKSFRFRGHEEEKPVDEIRSMSYRVSLGLILENLIVILALGPKTLAISCSVLATFQAEDRKRGARFIPDAYDHHVRGTEAGPDSLEWRPSRWIRPGAKKPGDEEIDINRRGVFLAWSEGTRDCPGKKFSQVEFVALMVGLFRQWRVDPVKKYSGESIETARRRVLDLIREDSG
ncbi:hypothetical protein F4813DRAFT_387133 [Daldinia decipiens]|uniref:uncharacterized protein n=1 Tax=Daldinia decipiens TaxID=326647 RepID=UPI0020C25863|nr:uncharacterized protein F4813DRAFT_387133 [Daldinia decipiens]KAI1660271.1 hypothetical protein F4813DRAFT_387133 [Daldinia decipiens]